MPLRAFSKHEVERYVGKLGDIFVVKSSGSNTNIVSGKLALVGRDTPAIVFSNFLMRVRAFPGEAYSPFIAYLLGSHLIRERIKRMVATTTYPNIDVAEYVTSKIPVPPIVDQEKITTFLDRETARIDALVAKKERLIELLQEKRTALITRAVTKGLDPNVPMKDSGVEWLGKIPAHWKVAPVYARYDVTLGKMLDAKRVTGDDLAPYLRNVDVQWDHVSIDDLPQMDFASNERDRYSLRPGDLLVCEGGEVGRTAVWRGEIEECFYQKAIHRVRPLSDRDRPRFFYYVMYSAAQRGVFAAGGNPNTIDHLTAVQLKRYRFSFPPEVEQGHIAEFLDVQTTKLESLADRISQGIDRLKELRTALISAAVTGKIDVRNATV
jgi:type I restriction enzyme S subunit